MKRFLVLVTAAVLFACLFALGVFADGIVANTITSEAYGTVYQLSEDPGLDGAGAYVSTLNTIEDQGKDNTSLSILFDGTYYYVFPTSYLVDEYSTGKLSFTLNMGAGNNFSKTQKGINDVFAEWNEAEGTALPTFEVLGTWGGTKLNFLVRIELTSDILYVDRSHCLLRGSELVEVRFTSALRTNQGSGFLAENPKLTTVGGIDYLDGTNLGTNLFYKCPSLVSVALPANTTKLPANIFNECTSFTGVSNWDDIKDNIKSIDMYAFKNCKSLVTIELPSQITYISEGLVEGCDLFVGFSNWDDIRDNITGFGAYAFKKCPSLKEISLPVGLTSINKGMFDSSPSLAAITNWDDVKGTITSIGNNAFYGTAITSIDLPNITSIGSYAFGSCKKLTTVTGFENSSLTTLPEGVFAECDTLTTVKLPTGLTAIPKKLFLKCYALESIGNWDEIAPNLTFIGEEAFNGSSKFGGAFSFPNVTEIVKNAFNNCDGITSLYVPKVEAIGNAAFGYCDNLATVDFGNAPLTTIGNAFRNCTVLNGIVLPETVTAIGQDGFHGCKELTYINIPRDCTTIGAYAFNGCSKLAVIDMSKSEKLKSTGQNSFGGVIVTELHFPQGFETFGGISCGTLVNLTFPDSTTSLATIKAGINEFRVPLGVTTLRDKQFDYCTNLQTIIIHEGVTGLSTTGNTSFFHTEPANIVYTGDADDEVVAQLTTVLKKAEVSYADNCLTYFGSHAWSGNTTMQKVDYFKEITFADTCTREGCGVCDVDPSKTIGAIFEDYGYSVTEKPINGKHSMIQCYKRNQEAYDKYVALRDSFEFGVVVSIVADPLNPENSDLVESKQTYIAKQSFIAHDYFDVGVSGISENQTGVSLVFCAYVIDNGEYYYLDGGETVKTATAKSHADLAPKAE
ncbi:MAG: leucine-rich repeat protein [Clostridia bacterium]|nr:leucine-rich repeat protein [Clostridia bacterium]